MPALLKPDDLNVYATTAEAPPFRVCRWTAEAYDELGRLGVLDESDRVELLDGWIVPKMIHGPPHDWCLTRLADMIRSQAPQCWIVRIQCAMHAGASRPEPDVLVASGPDSLYMRRHPGGADTALVVEVAETSLRQDRRKAAIYAGDAVPEYWIINLTDLQVEVHRRPDPAKREYLSLEIMREGECVTLHLDDQTHVEIAISDIMPPHPPVDAGAQPN